MWDSNRQKQGVHLLSLELFCSPKEKGGAGLKMIKIPNMAMLAKLGWRVLTEKEDVWCKFLRSKYGIQEEANMQLRVKQRASHIWKGIIWTIGLLPYGLRWRVGNRRRIRFWTNV